MRRIPRPARRRGSARRASRSRRWPRRGSGCTHHPRDPSNDTGRPRLLRVRRLPPAQSPETLAGRRSPLLGAQHAVARAHSQHLDHRRDDGERAARLGTLDAAWCDLGLGPVPPADFDHDGRTFRPSRDRHDQVGVIAMRTDRGREEFGADEDEVETRTRFRKNVTEPVAESAAERRQAAPGAGNWAAYSRAPRSDRRCTSVSIPMPFLDGGE